MTKQTVTKVKNKTHAPCIIGQSDRSESSYFIVVTMNLVFNIFTPCSHFYDATSAVLQIETYITRSYPIITILQW